MLSDLDSNVEPPRKAVEFVPENSSASFAPAAVNYSDKAVYRLPPLLTTSSLRGLRSPTLPQDANRERSSSFRPVRGATVFSEANPSAKTEGFLHCRRGHKVRAGGRTEHSFQIPSSARLPRTAGHSPWLSVHRCASILCWSKRARSAAIAAQLSNGTRSPLCRAGLFPRFHGRVD